MTHLKAIERIISLCPRLFYRETFVLIYRNSIQVLVLIDEKDRANFFSRITPEWHTKFEKYVDFRLRVDISAFSKVRAIDYLIADMTTQKIYTPKELREFAKHHDI
jgi:hypothetical protein